MKKLLILPLFFLLIVSSNVYSQAYKQGDKLLNVSIGLNSYYNGTPFGASFESGINENISVGAQFDYNSGNFGSYGYTSDWGYTAIYFGARGSYHFNEILGINDEKLDVYGGLGLGYQSFSWKASSYGLGYSYGSGVYLNYFVGGKYYFTEKIGAVLEAGSTGLSNVRAGITLKF